MNSVILHVDDNPADLALVKEAAKAAVDVYDVRGVGNATDALLYLDRIGNFSSAPSPHLILLDLSLPRVDGRELLEMLRSRRTFRSIPVVVLTDSNSLVDRTRCEELGVCAFFLKPHAFDDLVGIVRSLIRWVRADTDTSSSRITKIGGKYRLGK